MKIKDNIITAKFPGAEELTSVIKALIEKGYRVVEVHSPYPLEGIEDIIGHRESPVRFWAFIGGIIGLVTGFVFTIWTSLDWPHFTGGKPIVSLPPFLIIAFELTLLFGALGTIIGFMFHSRLPSLTGKGCLTGDQFGLTLIEKSDKIKSVEPLLSYLGAKEIVNEEWTGQRTVKLGIFAFQRSANIRGGCERERCLNTSFLKSLPIPPFDKGGQGGIWGERGFKYATIFIFIAMAILGIISFLIGISGAGTHRAWQIYFVNLLYWTGISLGGIIFTAILIITKAEWTKELKIIGIRFFPFIPISLILFLLTYFGRKDIFPWVSLDIGEKEKLLNIPFLYIRNIFRWIVLSILSWIFVRKRGEPNLTIPATILIIVFMFAFSFIGIDLVMSLSHEWVSTLFGGYFAIGAFYSGMSLILLLTLLLNIKVTSHELINMGKLIFGFSLFWASLFWAQYLVIWYGNIPEEMGFVYNRLKVPPWQGLSWVVITLNFFIPFILLLGKSAKANRLILFIVSMSITLGFFLERFILIVPSISTTVSFGFLELLVSIGFLGIFLLCISQKLLDKSKGKWHYLSWR